jgi:hypothetical protein
MDIKEPLYRFVDATVNGDEESLKNAAHEYSVNKVKQILGLVTPSTIVTNSVGIVESFKQQLLEYTGEDSPVKFDGDYVLVNGKKVGSIHNDLNDIDSGINFITLDKSFSKEFTTAEELYKFLMDRYGDKK